MRVALILSITASLFGLIGCVSGPVDVIDEDEEIILGDKGTVRSGSLQPLDFVSETADATVSELEVFQFETDSSETLVTGVVAGDGSVELFEDVDGQWVELDCQTDSCEVLGADQAGDERRFLMRVRNLSEEEDVEVLWARGADADLTSIAGEELRAWGGLERNDTFVCDVIRNGGQVASGITVAMGAGTATCAQVGGASAVATLGATTVVAAPICGTLGVGTLAAGATTLVLSASDIIACTNGLQMAVQNVREVADNAIEVFHGNRWNRLPCKLSYYLFHSANKDFWCKQPRRCVAETDTCPDNRRKVYAGSQCLTARRAKQQCWGQLADQAHRDEYNTTIDTLNRCIEQQPRVCGG